MQLDMFEDNLTTLTNEVEKLKKSTDNVRRGLFARHNELAKIFLEIKQEIDELKSFIGFKNQTQIIDLFQEEKYG